MPLLSSLNDTRALAQRVAVLLTAGDTLALHGDMGSGKTAFTGFVAEALGVTDVVTSPTFAIVNTYPLPHTMLWHFDCYRLAAPDEVLMAGWQESASGIRLIEWPQRITPLLPGDHLALILEHLSENSRQCTLTSHGPSWTERLRAAGL